LLPRLAFQELTNCPMRLVDRGVRICRASGIRIGDGDAAEFRPTDYVGTLVRGQDRLEQRVEFGCITVWPAVDGDGLDVAGRIKTCGGQYAGQLVTNIALERRERRCKQLGAPSLFCSCSQSPAEVGTRTIRRRIGSSGEEGLV